MQVALRRVRRRARSRLLRAAAPLAPSGDAPLPELAAIPRVLLVFLNFRLGNTLLATPAVAALTASFPATEFDFVGGPAAAAVMAGQRLRRLVAVPRREILTPLGMARLVARLRREAYGAAIHLSPATSSLGAFLVWASGAPHRIGCRRAQGNVYFTTTVESPRARHKVDQMREYLGRLGVIADGERELRLSDRERAAGTLRLTTACGEGPVVGVFLGARARKGKSWPLATAAEVVARLREAGLSVLVFIGPEERDRERQIRAQLRGARFVCEPDLRRVAALVSACAAAVSPDAGPMHLALAVGVPTVAVFRRGDADKWGPRPPLGVAVVDPSGHEVDRIVAGVLAWIAPRPPAPAALAAVRNRFPTMGAGE